MFLNIFSKRRVQYIHSGEMVENEGGAAFYFCGGSRGGRGRDTRTNVEQVVDVKPDTNMRSIVQIVIIMKMTDK
jgi:hypothetical protein